MYERIPRDKFRFNLPNKPDTYVLLHLVTSSARNLVLVSDITSAIVNMSRDEPRLVESKELVVRSWRFPKIARNFPISDALELFAPSPIIRPRIHRGAPLCAGWTVEICGHPCVNTKPAQPSASGATNARTRALK